MTEIQDINNIPELHSPFEQCRWQGVVELTQTGESDGLWQVLEL